MSSVSRKRFMQFVRQARGAKLMEIHVNRQNRRNSIVLRYNGRAPKQKSRMTGEYSISRGEKDDAALNEEINAFLKLAREHFFVHRGEGLEDAMFADEKMETKAKPIVGEKEQEAKT